MNNGDSDGVVFSKAIRLPDLMSKGSEFHIDIDFKNNKNRAPMFDDVDLIDEEVSSGDSDTELVLKNLEHSAEQNLLSSPEYVNFDELAPRMIDCLPSGEVKMLIIEEGSGPLVPCDALVTIHHAAYWERERAPFDCTLAQNFGSPITVRLGRGHLLPGLEVGLTSVRGPRARLHLLVAPAQAWGRLGCPPRVRPERALFTVALLDVRDVAAVDRFNDLPREEQQKFPTTLKTVGACKELARQLFAKRHYHKATRHYHKCIHVLQMSTPTHEDEHAEIKHLLCSVYVNLAVCYAKLKMAAKVILMCDELARLIDIDTHCKALFMYGKAFSMQGDYENAEKFYKKALRLQPKNPEIGKALSMLDGIIKTSAATEKAMWRTAFKNKDDTAKAVSVDADFKSEFRDMCVSLASRGEFAQFDLPAGLTRCEVDFMKEFVGKFEKLAVVEDENGGRRKISIVNKV